MPGPLKSTTPQKSLSAYFFFDDDFLLLDLDEDPLDELFDDFFDAAISAHHLSCRTGPPGRAYLATSAGLLRHHSFLMYTILINGIPLFEQLLI